jgi:hypothetical protein
LISRFYLRQEDVAAKVGTSGKCVAVAQASGRSSGFFARRPALGRSR